MMNKEALQLLLDKARVNAFEMVGGDSDAPLALVQDGYTLQSLEEYLPAPSRINQTVNLTSPQAFVAYVERFKTKTTAIFVGERNFTAKLDYHGPAPAPSWCGHVATYAPKDSHQWKSWLGNNKQQKSQLDFALFIESRLEDISKPEPATVMTAVLNFREAADQTVASSHKLDTGEINFQFVKENKTQNAKFPHELQLYLPIFEHHDGVLLDLYVRYRVQSDGLLRIWFQFKKDPIDIVREHFEAVSERIQDELKALPFFEGSAADVAE